MFYALHVRSSKKYATLESHETSTVFSGVRVDHLFSFLCCVLFLFCCVLFVFVLCLVCPMLSVSLGCPFLIAPSVFSKAYFNCLKYKMSWKIFPDRRLLMLKCLYQARKVSGHVYVCNVIDFVKHTPLSSLLMIVAMAATT